MRIVASPRHAEAFVVTGFPVTVAEGFLCQGQRFLSNARAAPPLSTTKTTMMNVMRLISASPLECF